MRKYDTKVRGFPARKRKRWGERVCMCVREREKDREKGRTTKKKNNETKRKTERNQEKD